MATVENVQKWKCALRNLNKRIKKYRISRPESIIEWLDFLCIEVLINERELQSLSKREQQRHRREDIMLSDVLGAHIKIYSKM